MNKVDNLMIIVGTNPMPNIISIVERLKDKGKIFLVVSEGYLREQEDFIKSISKNIIKLFPNNSYEEIVIDKNDPLKIEREVARVYKTLNLKEASLEVNYTGGTKLISSTIYKFFKSKMKNTEDNIILSYFDGIKGKFIIESKEREYCEEKFRNKEFENISIKDVLEAHEIRWRIDKNIGDLSRESIVLGEKFEGMNFNEKKAFIEKLNDAYKDIRNKAPKKSLEIIREFIGQEAFEKYSNKSNEKIKKFLFGDWFEEYYGYKLSVLKEDKIIDEFIWSFRNMKDKKYNDVEVDFIVRIGYKFVLLSVTLCEEFNICKLKLFEALTRAEQLAGDECKAIFICLYDSSKELESYISSIDKNIMDKVKILALDNLGEFNNEFLGIK